MKQIHTVCIASIISCTNGSGILCSLAFPDTVFRVLGSLWKTYREIWINLIRKHYSRGVRTPPKKYTCVATLSSTYVCIYDAKLCICLHLLLHLLWHFLHLLWHFFAFIVAFLCICCGISLHLLWHLFYFFLLCSTYMFANVLTQNVNAETNGSINVTNVSVDVSISVNKCINKRIKSYCVKIRSYLA